MDRARSVRTHNRGTPTRRALAAKTLAWLLALAIALAALAVWGLRTRTDTLRASDASGPVFPGLRDDLNGVTRIEVDTGAAPIVLVAGEGGAWVVQSLGNYPAQAETVKALLMGLAAMEYDEALTANPAKHGALGLAHPAPAGGGGGGESAGTGTRVRVFTGTPGAADDPAHASPRAAVILGSSTFQPARQSIRLDGDNQAWRVTGNATAGKDAVAWINRDIASIPVEQVQSLSFEGLEVKRPAPAEGAAATVTSPPDAVIPAPAVNWEIAIAGPVNWTPEDANRAKGPLTNFLARLECDDLRPLTPEALACDGQVIHYTLDGGALEATLVDHDGRTWVRLSGDAAPAHTQGFEFRLPEWKANQVRNLLPKVPEVAPVPAAPATPVSP